VENLIEYSIPASASGIETASIDRVNLINSKD
jgi:hypothetical protein